MRPSQIAQVKMDAITNPTRLPTQRPTLPHGVARLAPRKAAHATQIMNEATPFMSPLRSVTEFKRTPVKKYGQPQRPADNNSLRGASFISQLSTITSPTPSAFCYGSCSGSYARCACCMSWGAKRSRAGALPALAFQQAA
jgi:hypothetical protein